MTFTNAIRHGDFSLREKSAAKSCAARSSAAERMLSLVAKYGELALIQQLRSRVGRPSGPVRLGIGDDCAILRPLPGHELLVTTDFSLEGKHFRRDSHASVSVGHRCLARGLSDVAAMGGSPLAFFLSLALPGRLSSMAKGKRWIDGFFEGLLALADQTNTPLAGGDTAAAPDKCILADIVLLGSAPSGTALRRSGALPGHWVYVTGSLGGSAAELQMLKHKPKHFLHATADGDHPHLFPVGRLQQGKRLREDRLASAAIDISDGLSTDIAHLCAESGVGAVLRAEELPLHPLLAGLPREEALQLALHGGEDYELLFTARPGIRVPKRIGGVPLNRIGVITREAGVLLIDGKRQAELRPRGWEHAI